MTVWARRERSDHVLNKQKGGRERVSAALRRYAPVYTAVLVTRTARLFGVLGRSTQKAAR